MTEEMTTARLEGNLPPVPTTGDEMRTLWTKEAALNFEYGEAFPRHFALVAAMMEGLPAILNRLEEAESLVERLRKGSLEALREEWALEEDAYQRGWQDGYDVVAANS